MGNVQSLTRIEYQRRGVGLRAFEIVGRWQPVFQTALECITFFQLLCKLYMDARNLFLGCEVLYSLFVYFRSVSDLPHPRKSYEMDALHMAAAPGEAPDQLA